MNSDTAQTGAQNPDAITRKQELLTFLVTTFLIIPGLSVGFVAAFGFIIWISQMIFGPPGPPG